MAFKAALLGRVGYVERRMSLRLYYWQHHAAFLQNICGLDLIKSVAMIQRQQVNNSGALN